MYCIQYDIIKGSAGATKSLAYGPMGAHAHKYDLLPHFLTVLPPKLKKNLCVTRRSVGSEILKSFISEIVTFSAFPFPAPILKAILANSIVPTLLLRVVRKSFMSIKNKDILAIWSKFLAQI